jgi:hypothetical protein
MRRKNASQSDALAELLELTGKLNTARLRERQILRSQTRTLEEHTSVPLPSLGLGPNEGSLPEDESDLWSALQVQFSTEELMSAPLPSTASDIDADTQDGDQGSRLAATHVETVPQIPPFPREGSTEVGNPIVRESYDSTKELEDYPISPSPEDEIIVKSLIMTSLREAERVDKLVDRYNKCI